MTIIYQIHIKNINAFPENTIMINGDIIGPYPSGLEALTEALDKKIHEVTTSKLFKKAESL